MQVIESAIFGVNLYRICSCVQPAAPVHSHPGIAVTVPPTLN